LNHNFQIQLRVNMFNSLKVWS